jgi:hypothetical protein
MRKIEEKQMQLGEVDISKIEFDLKSRDEIPKLLRGLQHIYRTPELRREVFSILEQIVPRGTDRGNGRPGMELWKILVLGVLRLNCNWDYDKLREIANEHRTLRLMLRHTEDDEYQYPVQTLKDNVSLLTPEVLEKINTIVVKEGHRLLGKKKDGALMGRCDSFVVETDVHFPTDISLLFDSARKAVELTARRVDGKGWRQSKHIVRNLKKLYRRAQKAKRSSSKDPVKKEVKEKEIIKKHREYIMEAQRIICRVKESLGLTGDTAEADRTEKPSGVEDYIRHALRQIEQIRRRVIMGESIPHAEKFFSIFEPYTEWISKGKAGVPQEMGLKVCLIEDQHQFIIHHKVMRGQTDEQVAQEMLKATKDKHPSLAGCSFDKGFHSPDNRKKLPEIIDNVILPKKGKLTAGEALTESSEEFILARHRHAAVESAISALENHGLDRCLDNGLDGFERYVALAVVARNLQTLGGIIQSKQIKSRKRREKYNRTLAANKRSAA